MSMNLRVIGSENMPCRTAAEDSTYKALDMQSEKILQDRKIETYETAVSSAFFLLVVWKLLPCAPVRVHSELSRPVNRVQGLRKSGAYFHTIRRMELLQQCSLSPFRHAPEIPPVEEEVCAGVEVRNSADPTGNPYPS